MIRVLKIVFFFENYIGTDDWQCRYIRGRWCYVRSKVEKHMPYWEFVGTTE